MIPPFKLIVTERFLNQATELPPGVYDQLQKALRLLEDNPRHPSLRTHEVKCASGDYGGKIFEGYVNLQYRFTWEYGAEKSAIIMRNVDNHDECLKKP